MEWRIWIKWWIIFCIRFKRLFLIYLKKYETVADNPSIIIYLNKIENRITVKIKTGYYPEILTPETMKLIGNIINNINRDENDKNVPYLEVTEVVLVHWNIVNNDYQQDSRVLYTVLSNKSFGQLVDISYFKNCLIENFDTLKYGLLIKILNRLVF